jgi:orotidine-5'-phosphate decarboxylase
MRAASKHFCYRDLMQTSNHFGDRLGAAVRQKGTILCAGLDPRWDALPVEIQSRWGGGSLEAVAGAFEEFCLRVLEIVSTHVGVVKPQSAFFEACGPAGMAAMQKVLRRARQLGLLSILDGKRNDIASTAEAYADAALGGTLIGGVRHPVWDADALTINAYLGRDAVEPFLASARRDGRGLFVVARTSNRGAGQFQDLVCDGRPLYEHVAMAIDLWGRENLGPAGLGDVGAVVGATHPAELRQLRQLLPATWFLVPGFGAQGGTVDDVAGALRADGLGAIVNSARGLTACFAPTEPRWEAAIEAATRQAVAVLRKITPAAS